MAAVLALALALAATSPQVTLPALDAEAYFESGPFKRAQRLIVAGQTSSGVALLKRLLREHPDAAERPQARYLLGLERLSLLSELPADDVAAVHIEPVDDAQAALDAWLREARPEATVGLLDDGSKLLVAGAGSS